MSVLLLLPLLETSSVCGAGMGLTCLEELKWGDKAHPWIKPGTLFTRGPGKPQGWSWPAFELSL